MKRRSVVISAMLLAVSWFGCSQPENPRIIYASTPPPSEAEVTAPPSAAQAWTFDEAEPGRLPHGWRITETASAGKPAAWQVIADPTAPSPPHVLAITRTENQGRTYNLAIGPGPALQDVDLTVKVKAISGREDQGGGPVWRCHDADNYYICRWNPLEKNYRVYRVVAGKRTQIATADTQADPGQWHTLRAVMKGAHIECYLDGQKLLDANDNTITTPGAIGVWTKADAATAFDDVAVKSLE